MPARVVLPRSTTATVTLCAHFSLVRPYSAGAGVGRSAHALTEKRSCLQLSRSCWSLTLPSRPPPACLRRTASLLTVVVVGPWCCLRLQAVCSTCCATGNLCNKEAADLVRSRRRSQRPLSCGETSTRDSVRRPPAPRTSQRLFPTHSAPHTAAAPSPPLPSCVVAQTSPTSPTVRVCGIGGFHVHVVSTGHQVVPWGDPAALLNLARSLDADILVHGHTHTDAAVARQSLQPPPRQPRLRHRRLLLVQHRRRYPPSWCSHSPGAQCHGVRVRGARATMVRVRQDGVHADSAMMMAMMPRQHDEVMMIQR